MFRHSDPLAARHRTNVRETPDPKRMRTERTFTQEMEQNIPVDEEPLMFRRRSLVGVALVVLALAPRASRADVITFYGCAQELAGACILVNMVGAPGLVYTGLPVPNTLFAIPAQTPDGSRYVLDDSFSWSLPDGSCTGGGTSIGFTGNSCGALHVAEMVIVGRVQWAPAGAPGSLFLPTQSSLITFTATPEPASLTLAATGLLAIAGLARRRRGRRP